jgi:hypothetical protein
MTIYVVQRCVAYETGCVEVAKAFEVKADALAWIADPANESIGADGQRDDYWIEAVELVAPLGGRPEEPEP